MLPASIRAIRGHVFCSFLALLLRRALEKRLARKECKLEWADVIRDLDNLVEMQVSIEGKDHIFRGQASGVTGKVFQACGLACRPPCARAEIIPSLVPAEEQACHYTFFEAPNH